MLSPGSFSAGLFSPGLSSNVMVVTVACRLLFLVASCFFVGLLSLICLETDLGTQLCGIYTSSDSESYCFIRESWLGRAQVGDLGIYVY